MSKDVQKAKVSELSKEEKLALAHKKASKVGQVSYSLSDLARQTALQHDVPVAQVKAILATALSEIVKTTKNGHYYNLANFGSFKPKLKAARKGKTNLGSYDVPERLALTYKQSSVVKEELNSK